MIIQALLSFLDVSMFIFSLSSRSLIYHKMNIHVSLRKLKTDQARKKNVWNDINDGFYALFKHTTHNIWANGKAYLFKHPDHTDTHTQKKIPFDDGCDEKCCVRNEWMNEWKEHASKLKNSYISFLLLFFSLSCTSVTSRFNYVLIIVFIMKYFFLAVYEENKWKKKTHSLQFKYQHIFYELISFSFSLNEKSMIILQKRKRRKKWIKLKFHNHTLSSSFNKFHYVVAFSFLSFFSYFSFNSNTRRNETRQQIYFTEKYCTWKASSIYYVSYGLGPG